MTGRYSSFIEARDDYPASWFEACVFLQKAQYHLLNSGRAWSDEELSLITDVRYRLYKSAQEAA